VLIRIGESDGVAPNKFPDGLPPDVSEKEPKVGEGGLEDGRIDTNLKLHLFKGDA
jgi:hypothetical protein